MKTTPAYGYLAIAEVYSVPLKSRGALPNGVFTFIMEVIEII
jgi:hypothetical protein